MFDPTNEPETASCIKLAETVLAQHGGDHLEAAGSLLYSAVLCLIAKHGHAYALHTLESLVREDPFGLRAVSVQ